LRATTTVIEALAAGAAAVVPCLTVEDAFQQRATHRETLALLGGERGGRPIGGFDLGNSPAEYTPERIRDRTIVLTTTNGTKALLHCRAARGILTAGFVNLTAVVERLKRVLPTRAIHIVCAGTDGIITREDVLVAGAILTGLNTESNSLNDQALIAQNAWACVAAGRSGAELEVRLVEAMRASRGGQNLIEIGMAADIELAARIDRHAIVPTYDAHSGEIAIGGKHA
jgi:2-phosphosulfolactate phosphatase